MSKIDPFDKIDEWADAPTWHVCRFNVAYRSWLNGLVQDVAWPGLWGGTEEDQEEMRQKMLVLAQQIDTEVIVSSDVTGSISMFAGGSAPDDYLLCDGAAVSRTTYADLFAVIGTTYGAGDGSTTFNVPNLKSRFPVGAGQGSGLSNYALAATGGEEAHQLTVAEMPAHTHYVRTNAGYLTGGGAAGRPGSEAVDSGSAGGDDPHENRPPYLAVNFIIRI